MPMVFQSTPPVREATYDRNGKFVMSKISIHASREGGDFPFLRAERAAGRISIHASREGGDVLQGAASRIYDDFNPRLP